MKQFGRQFHGCLLAATCSLAVAISVRADSPARLPAPFPATTPDVKTATAIDFNQDVQPILAKRCFACHGPADQESGLALHKRDLATAPAESDAVAIVPGHADQSQLIKRVTAHDESERMPPEGPPLSREEIEILRQWIDSGADYQTHWSFVKPQAPTVPEVQTPEQAPQIIDHFVVSLPEAAGIKPSPPASRETLIRRLYLDLLGLLPPLEKREAFLADDSDNAYEKVVDELLASQHFGERWGRHWLDLARYADTFGYERDDVRPNAWRYRDWVVRSFNANQPYDQFVIEQLAGDQLDNPTQDQLIATGLHRINIKNMESGINKEDYRNREMVDRLNTTGTALLGLTIGCCQCHSHKYDPITQKEYYQLYAFFNNVVEKDIDIEGAPEEQAAYKKALAEYEATRADLKSRLAVLNALRAAGSAHAWRHEVEQENNHRRELAKLAESLVGTSTADDWHHHLTAEQAEAVGLPNEVIAALKVDAGERTEEQQAALAQGFENLAPLALAYAGKLQSIEDRLAALDVDDRLRSQLRADSDDVVKDAQLLEFWESLQTRVDETNKALRQQSVEQRHIPKPQMMTLAESKTEHRETFVLARGDFKQQTAIVFPEVPAVLPKIETWREDPNRLDLARWIVSPDNPLAARVAVNHIWLHLFGAGIVSTPDDFGTQGAPPSHPELLDWLALRFIDLGWDRKALIKTVVMSATYQQSSVYRPELKTIDPRNRLLARQSRFRVESEIVRDLFLDASGILCERMGGPTIHPDVPEAIKDLGYKYQTRWVVSNRPERYRRGMYIHFKRTNPYPSLMLFDNPEGNLCIAKRNRSNTPLQSLATLNDPVFLECAKALGRSLSRFQNSADDVLQQAALRCLSRSLQPNELETLRGLYDIERAYYESHEEEAVKLAGDYRLDDVSPAKTAAWIAVARTVLNLDEFYTRE